MRRQSLSRQSHGETNGGLAHAQSVSYKSSRCAVMTTHVDECELDAAKPLRTWTILRTHFAATDPVKMQKFLGVVHAAWTRSDDPGGWML